MNDLAQIRFKFTKPGATEIEVNGQQLADHVLGYSIIHDRGNLIPHVHLELLGEVEIEGPGIVEVTRHGDNA